jgi:hypothetical protein
MKKTDWKSLIELSGIVAVVASLIFVGLQIRQDQNIAIAQIYADHDDTVIEWATLLTDNRDVWIRGLKGDSLNDEESLTFHALAYTFFTKEGDRYARALLISPVPPNSIAQVVASAIHSYPPLLPIWNSLSYVQRERIESEQSALFGPFVTDVDSMLKDLADGSLVLPRPASFATM